MPQPSMAQVRGLGDFATLYKWNVQFITSPAGVDMSNEGFNLRATSASVPKKTTPPIDVQIRNHHIQRPGITDTDHVFTLNLMETEDLFVQTRVAEWFNKCQEYDTGKQGKYEEISCDILLQRLDREDNPVWEYTMVGCWASEFDPLGADLGSDGEFARPVLTLAYDDFDQKPA